MAESQRDKLVKLEFLVDKAFSHICDAQKIIQNDVSRRMVQCVHPNSRAKGFFDNALADILNYIEKTMEEFAKPMLFIDQMQEIERLEAKLKTAVFYIPPPGEEVSTDPSLIEQAFSVD